MEEIKNEMRLGQNSPFLSIGWPGLAIMASFACLFL